MAAAIFQFQRPVRWYQRAQAYKTPNITTAAAARIGHIRLLL
jgi:hypothetical protein